MIKLITIPLILFLCVPLFSQVNQERNKEIEEFYNKINIKLIQDGDYLNAFYVDYNSDTEIGFPGTVPLYEEGENYNLQKKPNSVSLNLKIYFLKETLEINRLVLLKVDEIQIIQEQAGVFETRARPDSITVLDFSDLYNLYLNNKTVYDQIYDVVYKKVTEDLTSGRAIHVKSLFDDTKLENLETLDFGTFADDNNDYLNYMRNNYNHIYPVRKINVEGLEATYGRVTEESSYEKARRLKIQKNNLIREQELNQALLDSAGTRDSSLVLRQNIIRDDLNRINIELNPLKELPMNLDASFTSISFWHESMKFFIPPYGLSIEVGTGEEVQNLLPYQNFSFYAGLRTLIDLSPSKSEIKQKDFLDLKVLGKFRLDTKKTLDEIDFITRQKLNTTQGVAFDIKLTRPFNLPYVNLYFETHQKDYDDPFTRFRGQDGETYAYYSFINAAATFSFYWNTSSKRDHRFRLDLGAGYLDVWKAYYKPEKSTEYKYEKAFDQSLPLAELHYNFVPNNNELFGARVRWFDSQLRITGWFKLLSFSANDVLRIEGTFLSAPVMRLDREWDSRGGAIIQFRYRYGF